MRFRIGKIFEKFVVLLVLLLVIEVVVVVILGVNFNPFFRLKSDIQILRNKNKTLNT